MKSIFLSNKAKLFFGSFLILAAILIVLSSFLISTKAELTEGNTTKVLSPENIVISYPNNTVGEVLKTTEPVVNPEKVTEVVKEDISPIVENTEVDKEVPVAPASSITGDFIDPLLACDYAFARGFSDYHLGVDLASVTEPCKINSIASGTIITAGWGNSGQGFHIVIEHGNNIFSEYYHGSGVLYANVGDSVSQGQEIMEMGCTGFCTGKHLHLVLRNGEDKLDPQGYITFR